MNDDLSATTKLVTSLRPLCSFGWRMLLTLTVIRFIFVSWQWQRVADADMFGPVLVQGFQFDLVLSGLMLAIPVLAFPILASNRFLVPAWRALLSVCLPIALLIIVFMECSTPSFVDQFDNRPNILFMEYLNHPREVATTLWGAYKLPIMVAILFVTSLTWLNSRQIGRLVTQIQPTGLIPAILVTPLLLIICFGLIRSSMDHHLVNPSAVALSNDPLVNELALSSTYAAFHQENLPAQQ